jgi:hypothetical protein
MTKINVAGLNILTRGWAITRSMTYRQRLRGGYPIDKPIVDYTECLGLDIGDLQDLGKGGETIR